jgi:hypothetical protein
MFLYVRHRNFVFSSTGHHAVSNGQIYFEFFYLQDTMQCLRSSHEFRVFRRQKYAKQYFSDQATNKKCLSDTFPSAYNYFAEPIQHTKHS